MAEPTKEELDDMAKELAQHHSATFDKLGPAEQGIVRRRFKEQTKLTPITDDHWD